MLSENNVISPVFELVDGGIVLGAMGFTFLRIPPGFMNPGLIFFLDPILGHSWHGTLSGPQMMDTFIWVAGILGDVEMSMILSPGKLYNMSPQKGAISKGAFIFQASISSGYVSFRGFVYFALIRTGSYHSILFFHRVVFWGDFQCYPKWLVVRAIQAEDEDESWAEEEVELET